jgi:hypothetical protein
MHAVNATKRWRPIAGIATALLLALAAAQSVASDPAAEEGDRWEVTSRMSMEGLPMQMPAQTQRVCAKRNEAPTENPDPNCTTTDVARTGNRVSWRVECTGENPMSGRAEILFQSADAYTGTIRFDSAQGAMRLELSGKRIGRCPAPR